MTHPTITQPDTVERTSEDFRRPGLRSRRRRYGNLAVGLLVVIGATAGGLAWKYAKQSGPQSPPPPPPEVTVAPPVQRTIAATRGFLGQFSAVENVELRAQVGGTLAAIDFRDGQVVQKGEPLFLIDPGRSRSGWTRRSRSSRPPRLGRRLRTRSCGAPSN